MEEYDLVVIGAGPGGYVAALHAAKLGLKTLCIDKGPTFGGTCLNVGCIPSKALLQSSEHYAFIQEKVRDHGIEAETHLNFPKMMQRKNEIVEGLVKGIEWLFQNGGVAWKIGSARFRSPNEIEVNSETVRAKNVMIATGSESISLPFLPFDEKNVLSSTGALSLTEVPKTMIVIGAGVIGVELASVYRRLGAEVTLVEMLDHICPAMDGAVSKTLLSALKRQGLNFHLSTQVKSVEKNSLIKLIVNHGGKESVLEAEKVLVAVGRRPYTKELGLKEIGIELDAKGFIPVDGNFRTKYPHIYAIGDVVDGPMLAHRASDEGVAVVDLIAKKRTLRINYLAIPNVIYTHPEVAALGVTEEEAKALKVEIKVGTAVFKANPRARCNGETDGLVKVIAEAQSGCLIGMHIMGEHASEMIGEGVAAIEKKMTLKELAYASHAHPTLSESIKEAADKAYRG